MSIVLKLRGFYTITTNLTDVSTDINTKGNLLMHKIILTALMLFTSYSALADAPIYSEGWQWNNNVKIDYI